MSISELKIDFLEGEFYLCGVNIHERFPEVLREGECVEEEVLFGSYYVKVLINFGSDLLEVSLTPRDDLSFWDADKMANKICSEVNTLARKKSYRSKILFGWGEVLLLSEWRDGGRGAFFKLYDKKLYK